MSASTVWTPAAFSSSVCTLHPKPYIHIHILIHTYTYISIYIHICMCMHICIYIQLHRTPYTLNLKFTWRVSGARRALRWSGRLPRIAHATPAIVFGKIFNKTETGLSNRILALNKSSQCPKGGILGSIPKTETRGPAGYSRTFRVVLFSLGRGRGGG